jgi:hypothetical protein
VRPVQLILIVLLIALIYLYFSRLRSGILDRVAVLAFALGGMVMVAFPDVTMKMAGAVGVGRGADLFTYLSLVGFAFFGLVLYSKIRDLEATITDLSRVIALQTASRRPNAVDSTGPSEGNK